MTSQAARNIQISIQADNQTEEVYNGRSKQTHAPKATLWQMYLDPIHFFQYLAEQIKAASIFMTIKGTLGAVY